VPTATTVPPAPTLADLRRTATVFNSFANADTTWLRLTEDTKPGIDLGRADHRQLMLRWLNTWGCRIRYPRPGEPAPFDASLAAWWETFGDTLPQTSLTLLSDNQIDAIAAAFDDLARVPVSQGKVRRALGPTAASKALYALRPAAIMPWDAAIAKRMHTVRDGGAFGRHLRLGREWAATVIAEAGGDEAAVPAMVCRPIVSLAKLLDEYLYVTITMKG
jgi:hypothetical protein